MVEPDCPAGAHRDVDRRQSARPAQRRRDVRAGRRRGGRARQYRAGRSVDVERRRPHARARHFGRDGRRGGHGANRGTAIWPRAKRGVGLFAARRDERFDVRRGCRRGRSRRIRRLARSWRFAARRDHARKAAGTAPVALRRPRHNRRCTDGARRRHCRRNTVSRSASLEWPRGQRRPRRRRAAGHYRGRHASGARRVRSRFRRQSAYSGAS